MAYPDAEKLLVDWLPANLAGFSPAGRVVTELPDQVEAQLPVIQVAKITGADRVISLDDVIVDIIAYQATRIQALGLAEQIRTAMRLVLPGKVVNGAVVTKVTTAAGPILIPYENPRIRRALTTYELKLHASP